MKIVKKQIQKLSLPGSGQKFYWDDKLKGFGVKATRNGLTFVIQLRIEGKTVRHSIGKYGEITCEEARKKAAQALAKLRDGINLNKPVVEKAQISESISLRKAYSDFKNSRKLRPRTIQTYDQAVYAYLGDWLDLPLLEINKHMIEKRHKEISSTPGVRGNRSAQANGAMRVLRSVYNYAKFTYEDSQGKPIIINNPVLRLSHIKAWNKIPRRQDIIQKHELADWYSSVLKLKDTTMRDYLILCLFTGLRRSEAMKIKWEDVEYTITKTLTIPGYNTKNHDTHVLPLSDYLCHIFSERAKTRRINNEYVFAREFGSGHIIEPKYAIKRVIKDTGIKFSMHTLRRTFETIAEGLDLPYYALKRLLNHKIDNDVTSGYIITNVERLRQPMQRITDELLRQVFDIK